MRTIMRTGILFICITYLQAQAAQRYRSEVIARNGMAATSHPLATQIAIDILQQGGSAVDAAIAANAALGVLEPMSCGIGGDLFAIVWDAKTKSLHGLNSSGRSPKSLTIDFFRENGYEQVPLRGPLSLSVPGCVDGWFTLHDKFGVLPMQVILQPAIDYAAEGAPVPEIIAGHWANGIRNYGDQPNFIATYGVHGAAPAKGELFRNPALAATYANIAANGRDAFYRGDIARTIDAFVREMGGFLSCDDLAAHTSEWVAPLSTSYRGYDVWELPPNGQGIAVLQMLNILERFDLRAFGFGSVDHLHAIIEAKKLVFADRARFYADTDFAAVPIDELISKEYAAHRFELIDMHRAGTDYSAGQISEGETIYLCTADNNGNMVSLIQSNYYGFGSALAPDDLGFVLQNRGALFTLQEGHANVYEPGKRPFHTIIPGFVTRDGAPYMAFGVMGGDFQPQGQVQVLINMIDFDMDLQEAGDAPRLAHEGSSTPRGDKSAADGGEVGLEDYFNAEVAEQLRDRGHRVRVSNSAMFYGGYQAIKFDAERGVYFGATEIRNDGHVAGY
ncbi:gamma-glutamyltransferase [candidate division KSB1 bacterium]|nr:gamma-glutamyltransferase [candidate division KSB1 bacterium]RQW09425.1 MAG: gamma-glutamyltransferase [candidate division KSB1 bacterium]